MKDGKAQAPSISRYALYPLPSSRCSVARSAAASPCGYAREGRPSRAAAGACACSPRVGAGEAHGVECRLRLTYSPACLTACVARCTTPAHQHAPAGAVIAAAAAVTAAAAVAAAVTALVLLKALRRPLLLVPAMRARFVVIAAAAAAVAVLSTVPAAASAAAAAAAAVELAPRPDARDAGWLCSAAGALLHHSKRLGRSRCGRW